MLKTCIICGDQFDLNSPQKQEAGGKINHCAECSDETEIKYAGVQSADGKQAQATILKFESEADKNKYIAFWRNNSGYNKGKSCQLGDHLSTTPNIKFETINKFVPTNHKGKNG